MSKCKTVTLATLALLMIINLVFYFIPLHNVLHAQNLVRTLVFSTPQLSNVSQDPSAEKDATIKAEGFSVLEALKRDGYTLVAVSMVGVFGPSPGSTNPCSNESQPATLINNAPYNLTTAVYNSSIEESFANNRCQPVDIQLNVTQGLKVPNVVHYVFLGSDLTFTFTNYLSYRSVDRFIRPDQIFIHGDHIPSGKWWNRTINEVKNIYHVTRTYSKNAPNGQPYIFPAHISDYMRTETLLRYGGIYLDADVLVVKSFNPLRQFPFVIGRENDGGLCNGIMLAERGAPFLRLLLEQYHSYLGSKESWAGKSVLNTHTLAVLYPHLVHIEEKTLNRPNWQEKATIYDGLYNWKQNYAVHLWIRLWPNEKRPNGVEDILTKNTTLAELARLTIFGSHEIRDNVTNTTAS